MWWADALLWISMGMNLLAAGLNIRAAVKLREARRAAEMVGEAYSKALEALIENENIREDRNRI